ncbi:OmpA family protein [Alloalcanivorax xenomutans]|jgi:outer membrane protein OmpA-like peptidoglycan-associated protein|uniref:OmpA family protein n=1 Tax=Alloalcanivorax xenomutans TaxID=1094342 RepID=A0A9Q3W421_9GAMM|nr:OmpA family protein [Alloalcanivorax xenomutans]ERS14020.1 cell envelope biogenesis protein OmpA [Alcanivorax sp. PN-3]KYZ87918.1 cell envelope biogenesis protein OmpA [Alcanivorax sp. KX64203]MBA4721001.1 OmpA family protein [Alcanivorax sp.]ARB45910.1 cell envelope biogenesis protein OmpA [Alloalcanivorax xenomutans]MCE7510215.1 OmpA family protein [Alloalcanivorax xenomutans]|tara:strand:- start:33 stop:698 length:666 start_codon:yes stop_codon:yes gene_type:complete
MKRILGCSMLAAAITLAGCSTVNPYTGEKQTSKAATGGAIGAVAGALIGIATSDNAKERKERALAGAGIGAVAGGGVGYYMDVQEKKLRDKLQATGVSVTRSGDNIILNMPGNVTFDTDQSDVKSNFRPVLESVSEVLKEYKSTMIQVAGHTDSTGGERYNLLLSQQRAQSVANVLSSYGVETVRLDVVGFGETQPIANNGTAQGREQNRRVELTLLPYTK